MVVRFHLVRFSFDTFLPAGLTARERASGGAVCGGDDDEKRRAAGRCRPKGGHFSPLSRLALAKPGPASLCSLPLFDVRK